MKRQSRLQWLCTVLATFLLVNTVEIPLQWSQTFTEADWGTAAFAKRGGGRSGGGSFSRPSSSSRSRSSSGSSRSRSSGSSSGGGSFSRPSTPSTSSGSSTGTTGGRAGGGSFQRQTTPTPTPYQAPTYSQPPSYPRRDTVIIPVPIQRPYPVYIPPQAPTYSTPVSTPVPTAPSAPTSPSGNNSSTAIPPTTTPSTQTASSDDGLLMFLLGLIVLGGVGFAIYWLLFRRRGQNQLNELDNDIVTVSKLQVGLLAQARSVQTQLTELSLNADTETTEGLAELLQESALALLRVSDCWTHVRASSQTLKSREEAEKQFQQMSIQERSRFTVETLSNVKGQVRQQARVSGGEEADPGAYFVVTLLVGTEDDKPLFSDIYSDSELKEALNRLAGTPLDYLLTFELLWTPQSEQESLTYDELLTEYADLIQIA